jgi:hypothetical protein
MTTFKSKHALIITAGFLFLQGIFVAAFCGIPLHVNRYQFNAPKSDLNRRGSFSSCIGQSKNSRMSTELLMGGEEFKSFDELEEDRKLEDEMARELYDELRAGKPGLPIEDFLKWDDVVDIMSSGVIDDETMGVIIEEVGVKDGVLTFEKFRELVDLVNQVAIAFEHEAELMNEFDIDSEDGDGADGADSSDDPYKWMLEAMMKNTKKAP